MKKIIGLFVLLCMSLFSLSCTAFCDNEVIINETNFPDSQFREYVTKLFNKNEGATLTQANLDSIKSIDISNKNITDTKGIEYFKNLKKLLVYSNKNLNELDVSSNLNLETLYCNNTNISKLDISNNTALTYLQCDNTNISELNVSNNSDLTYFYCKYTNISKLDFSNNLKLYLLDCSYCTKLTELNVSKCTDLNSLQIINTNLTTLDLSSCTNLNELICSGCEALKTLNCSNTKIKNLLVYDSYSLTELNIANNNMVTFINCSNSKVSSLDVSSNPALKTLNCSNTKIAELDVSKNSALEKLICSNTLINKLDLDKNTALKHLDCENTLISKLDVSKNSALEKLNCNNTRLKDLDLSKNTALTSFSASSSFEEALDFDGENSFFIDLSKVVTDTTRLSIDSLSEGGSYNPATKLVSFKASPAVINYTYLTGNGTYALKATMTLKPNKKFLSVDDFKIVPYTSLIYDGMAKAVTASTALTDVGAYSVYIVNENNEKCDAINAGGYKAVVSVEGNDIYYPIKLYCPISIAKKEITVKADNKSIVYGDDVDSLTYKITKGSLLEGDKLEGKLEIGKTSLSSSNNYSAGNHSGAITQGTLKTTDNYAINFENGDLIVSPKAVEIEWVGEDSFEFDNTVKKVSAICKNLIDGDTASLILGGTTEATEVGEYTAYVIGIDNEDYVVSDGAIGIEKKWSITKSNTPYYEYMLGNVNLDDNINTNDATAIISEVLRKNADKYITNDADYLKIADINGDGEITPADATKIIEDVLKPEADKVLKNIIITTSKDLKALYANK